MKQLELRMYTKRLVESLLPGIRVRQTDNANARAIGKLPKWTVQTSNVGASVQHFDTLAEIVEWFSCRRKPQGD